MKYDELTIEQYKELILRFPIGMPVVRQGRPDWRIGVVQSVSSETGVITCGWWAERGYFQFGCLPESLAPAAAAITDLQAQVDQERAKVGWIVGNGDGTRFRSWDAFGPCWVTDPEKAVRYARRDDAELAHGCDEDAWLMIEYRTIERGDHVS